MNTQINDEIDLIKIIRKLFNSLKTLIIITLSFSVIGITLSLISPIKYKASTIFILQNQNTSSSSLSGFANLVGINLSSNLSGSGIPTSIYPEIGNSPKFKRLLLESIIDSEKNKSFESILIDNYGLDNNSSVNNTSSIYVSKFEEDCFKIISKIISIDVNTKDGYINITTNMSNGKYAAIVANKSKDILQNIIIENKIESAKQTLNFSLEQLKEKQEEFNEIQKKLSSFKDSNLNLVNSLFINEQNKLEAEFNIINAVVTELSKQVELAKLEVSKNTPVFSTIKEAVIPNTKDSPYRAKIVIIYTIIGFIFSITYVLILEPLKRLLKEIKR